MNVQISTYFAPWIILHSTDKIMVKGVTNFEETIHNFFKFISQMLLETFEQS